MRRLKNDVNVSLAYKLAFFMPFPTVAAVERLCGFGDASTAMGMTAGSGIDGAGETLRRDDEKDDLLLWLTALGGFIGSVVEVGVSGADSVGGDPTDDSRTGS